jgi:prepilin-type N-terminal cleavage/methylation domain-containing protein
MKRKYKSSAKAGQNGFSLIELLIVVAILAAVMGVVTKSLINLQKRSNADFGKVDATQQTRQFMDQITNDIHQVGFPSPRMFSIVVPPTPPATAPTYVVPDPNNPADPLYNSVSRGLINATATQLHFDADLDGSGAVYAVYINLLVPAGGTTCPCTLQRGIIAKANDNPSAVPYYTEVNNVMNQNIFSGYDNAGIQIFPNNPLNQTIAQVKTISMFVDVQSTTQEPNGTYPTVTILAQAKINN